MLPYQYDNSHFGDNLVMKSCYLHDANSFTGYLLGILLPVNVMVQLQMICTNIKLFLPEDDNVDGHNLIRISGYYRHQIDSVNIVFGLKLGAF